MGVYLYLYFEIFYVRTRNYQTPNYGSHEKDWPMKMFKISVANGIMCIVHLKAVLVPTRYQFQDLFDGPYFINYIYPWHSFVITDTFTWKSF